MIPSFLFFTYLYVMSFVFVVSSEDWFLVWFGLEMNMMAFLVLVYRRYSLNSIESCLKYFFIQGLGSALLISFLFLSKNSMGSICSLILSYKIGAGPFFFWFPSLCSGLEWLSCYLLMMFQSILPLCLIYLFIHWMIWVVVFFGLVMGILGSFNQSNIKKLLAYSSIHHLGWIMIIGLASNISWMMYLIIYA